MPPDPKSRAAHALQWLRGQPGFRDLAAQAEDLVRLQSDLDECAPMRGLVAASLQDGVLVLLASNAAHAAKVRQFGPSLAEALARKGWRVARIKCRPQPGRATIAPQRARGAEKPAIPTDAIASFERLTQRTEAGPLRDALERLIARRRRAPR